MSQPEPNSILLVDDDDDLRESLATSLRLSGFAVVEASDGQQAMALLGDQRIAVVISDLRMPMLDGRQLLRRVIAADPELPVILITGHGDIDLAVETVRSGAYDFLAKPFATDRLVETTRRALDRRLLVLENRRLRDKISIVDQNRTMPLLGTSPAIQQLIRTIEQIGNADIDVLIEGEPGTGKIAVAHLLHASTRGAMAPILLFDCAAIPSHHIDAELFGQSATTGSKRNRRHDGRLAEMQGGTLVIASVERLAAHTQSRLYHELAQRDLIHDRSGASPSTYRSRIISTSAVSVSQKVSAGEFRSELYFRIAPLRLEVPPLRARRHDIPILFAQMMRTSAERYQRDVPALSDEMLARLVNHDWPGNLRELQNFADQVVLNLATAEAQLTNDSAGLAQRVAHFEAEAISDALSKETGDIPRTAKRLMIPRKTLYDKIAKYNLQLAQFRNPTDPKSGSSA